ncbi:MAG: DUF503 domain-containing protein [Anaerolineae bacterium]|jgi:uncharacterized protein YlxP (DUF503 family)|nr:DUF503 domain-containing protein [Anaerolineae bacterium]MDH7472965.1 DUF503 domain-containing protein [Anaerolineae bacterium]
MIIGLCTIELHLPGNGSLKDKRRVLKSIIARVHREFNVSIAEVDHQDVWQSAVLGVVCVSNGNNYVHGLLTKVVEWIEHNRPDVQVVDFKIEIL